MAREASAESAGVAATEPAAMAAARALGEGCGRNAQ